MIPRLAALPAPSAPALEFLDELRLRGFAGDISAGYDDRLMMATDNSIYQRQPQAVVFPRGVEDLQRIAKVAGDPRFHSLAIGPRGGGTGTNGQSLTEGIVVDVSRHMNRLLEVNAEEGWVRVEPGLVKDALNAAIKPLGLFFAPECSTSNRATLGGMISTDACGQGSCLYGKTRDHVLSLSVVLMDGTLWESRKLSDEELATVARRQDMVGAIHRVADGIAREQAQLIAERFPPLNRCLTGYDLAHLRDEQGRFDLNSLLCGSEGTLAMIAEARIQVLPIPKRSALINLRYDSFDAALRDARVLMALGAASVETVDSKVLGLARGDIVWSGIAEFFPDDPEGPAAGINLIEFVGDTEEEVREKLAPVEARLAAEGRAFGRRGHTIAWDAAGTRIQGMRKRGVGLLGNMKGEKRPIPFVEDTAVPPENLADFIAEFRAALDRRGLEYGMFGHVDAGVLHVRPAIDMKAEGAEQLIREVSDEVFALTRKYGGLLWGEHGKGVRSEYVPEVFGPLYPALQAVKAAFDPRNQLNPGKIAAPDGEALLAIDRVPMRGQLDRTIPADVRAGYEEALHCNGNGACFNYDTQDAMCPSFKVTGDRRHSPKGRASLFREWLRLLSAAGVDPVAEARRQRGLGFLAGLPARIGNSLGRRRGEADFSHQVKEAMDGCLACKSCSGQCPIKVDVPTFRAKFLELYHTRYLRPLRDYILGGLEAALPSAARMPKLANALLGSAPGRAMGRWIGLVDSPLLSGIDLLDQAAARGITLASPEALAAIPAAERERHVVLVQDAFTSHFETGLVLDLAEALSRMGFTPWLAPYRPNGKPLHVHGFLGAFGRQAASNTAMLQGLAASGVALVGIDPSMTLTYRSEYKEFAPPPVLLPQEFLARRLPLLPQLPPGEGFALLPHCTERTNATASLQDWQAVFMRLGTPLTILASGCCGMAGTYGHEAEHRATSEALYDLSWRGHVAKQGARLLATGYSCRSQVKRFDGAQLRHPVQALLARLKEARPASDLSKAA
ncbi:FAD-binding and (Fe-S)-binding domain-containing protein [Pseudoroseomonas cervicalis]|uniref:D-2-hydroxyglutarate dehydrogenase YdiJ n=1 Tax=Teichococcus cervicalis TaxID=204525 RepID=UPI0027891BA4|nr:FAD-binding and (Fe-S)-binding domain-containing protein [Pseudoroseomonas cervicalis]MDQ1079345.1 FAD/FMN-containing dehydrogenase/Fe-S oxidoreductase [Pseudoroseomonas cervicalis]